MEGRAQRTAHATPRCACTEVSQAPRSHPLEEDIARLERLIAGYSIVVKPHGSVRFACPQCVEDGECPRRDRATSQRGLKSSIHWNERFTL